MVKNLQVYKCEVCGAMVEGLNSANGTLHCCGKPMTALVENTTEAATEKHIPVVEIKEGGVSVKVGEVEHPMLDTHWIQWIEVIKADGEILRKELKPGQKPEAVFVTEGEVVKVREYCNLHGLWSK